MVSTSACDDCLVSYICDRQPHEAVVITIDELRSMRSLTEAGLVPSLKHQTAPPSGEAVRVGGQGSVSGGGAATMEG